MVENTLPLANNKGVKMVNISDAVFKLHSKFTVVLLLTFILLLSAKFYFGDPIQCKTDMNFTDFVHSYCRTIGNFLVPGAIEEPHNNISAEVGLDSSKSNRFTIDTVNLRYYQWVVVVLFVEAVVFYLPAYLWKRWEGHRMVELCSPVAKTLIPSDTWTKHCQLLVCYFNSNNSLLHGNYAIQYVTCDFLNIIIGGFNILFLDCFLNGFWIKYIDVSVNDWHFWDQRTAQIFPNLTECTIYAFDMDGSINNHEAMCMLPLNVINEKIFGFLWIWFTLLFVLAFLKMLYHLCILNSSLLRAHLLGLRLPSVPYFVIREVLNKRSVGDWFVLHKISLSVNSRFFQDFFIELYTCRCINNLEIV